MPIYLDKQRNHLRGILKLKRFLFSETIYEKNFILCIFYTIFIPKVSNVNSVQKTTSFRVNVNVLTAYK